jgi:purine catabolism regulator
MTVSATGYRLGDMAERQATLSEQADGERRRFVDGTSARIVQPAGDPGTGLTVRELLGFRELGLELLAGETGTGRRVTGACEISSAGRSSDQLILVPADHLPPGPGAQVKLVRDLVETGAAAVCLETCAPIHRELLAIAQSIGVPVLTIPGCERFDPLTQIVENFAPEESDNGREIRLYLDTLDSMRWAASGDYSPRLLLERLSTVAGFTLFVVSPSGRRLFPATRALPPELAAEIESIEPHRVVLEGGYVLRIELKGRNAALLVGIETADREPLGLQALRHVATVATVMVSHLYNEREQRRRDGAATLTALLAGALAPEAIGERLDAAGFPADSPVTLAACRPLEADCGDDDLFHMLSDEEIPSLVLTHDQDILVLLPAGRVHLARLVGAGFVLGASRPVEELVELSAARREALWCLERAAATRATKAVVFGQTDEFALWLPTDAAALRQLVASVLGPLLRYDEDSGTHLVPSLATFFKHQRKLAPAADELYVHKHTLSYRLRRVEELTQRDLRTMEDQVQFWMALKALAVIDAPAVAKDPRLVL